jgi:hypothetical protein
MPSKWLSFWSNSAFWRAFIALTLSLIIHLVILGGLDLHMPSLHRAESIIDMRLVQPSAPPVLDKVAAPVQQVRKPRPKPAPPPPPENPPAAPEAQAASPDTQPAEPNVAAGDQAQDNQAAASDSAESATAENAENQPAGLILNTSAYIEMDFDLRRKADGGTVGVAHISYKQRPDGTYKLSNVAEAKGLMSLFLSGQLVQTSEGKVTTSGLQPVQYVYQFGDKADKSQHATFDWQAGKVTLENSRRTVSVALPDGTQDLLSFMFQFMFEPPQKEMQLSITNGKKLRSYAYSFEGEDQLQTKIGNLRTMHIGRSTGDGDEKTELWLAVDLHYLPVKIRQTEKDGSVIEQIVTSLSTDILK